MTQPNMVVSGPCKVFVGGLPCDITEDELQQVFGSYGVVTDLHVMSANKSNSGQACAFVVFSASQSAEDAIAALDGVYSIRENGDPPIRVSFARASAPARHVSTLVGMHTPRVILPRNAGEPVHGAAGPVGSPVPARIVHHSSVEQYRTLATNTADFGSGDQECDQGLVPTPPPALMLTDKPRKLFVGNLPADITQDAISVVFSHYGTVTNVHTMVGRSKSGQACAFVEYSHPIEAETAALTLNERYEIRPGEGPILVKFASSQQRSAPY